MRNYSFSRVKMQLQKIRHSRIKIIRLLNIGELKEKHIHVEYIYK